MWEDEPDTDYDMLFSPSSTGYDFGFTPFEIYKDEDGNEYAYNPDTQEYYYLDSAVAPGTENVGNEELDAQLGQAYTQAGVTAPAATTSPSGGNAVTVPSAAPKPGTSAAPKPDILTSIANALKTPAGMAAAATALYGLSGGARPQVGGYRGTIPKYTATREQITQPTYKPYSGETVMGRQFFTPTTYTKMAEGGIAAAPRSFYAGLNTGGIASLAEGRYLRGGTDGMADKIPSSIEGKQPAALSHGEFVIPADVVSHLGNGNSEAGANQLYKMMDRVRKARTGNSKQGKEINPDKMMPKYAQGGVVGFQAGGAPTDRGIGVSSASPFGTTAETSLAPWVGDYVTDYLGKVQALAATPFQTYTGPLAAGTSPLQTKAFTEAEGLTPGATFTGEAVQQYMNPYLQQALEPQIAEARRQADISRSAMLGRLTKSGAYGGGRQAIMESELERNLLRNLSDITGRGYATAFDKAMNQYNIGREQTLKDIGAIAGLGGQQRAVEQEGIAALQKEFEKEKAFPYQQLQFQQGLLQGLPIGTTSITPNLSDLQRFGQLGTDVTKIYDFLSQIPGFKSSGTASPGETK